MRTARNAWTQLIALSLPKTAFHPVIENALLMPFLCPPRALRIPHALLMRSSCPPRALLQVGRWPCRKWDTALWHISWASRSMTPCFAGHHDQSHHASLGITIYVTINDTMLEQSLVLLLGMAPHRPTTQAHLGRRGCRGEVHYLHHQLVLHVKEGPSATCMGGARRAWGGQDRARVRAVRFESVWRPVTQATENRKQATGNSCTGNMLPGLVLDRRCTVCMHAP